jgi:pimeloyl-ACP methyl ester carboxylesterase
MSEQSVRRPVQRVELVTADEWFSGGRRLAYDPVRRRILGDVDGHEPAVGIFERTALPPGTAVSDEATWLTLLPGFPDGSYGWAQVDRLLDPRLGPRLYVEPVGQGDSDTPPGYAYSTFERADLVQALWRHHGMRHTVLVTFDYGSLVALELLRRQLDESGPGRWSGPITAVFLINGGLFADAHSHPWQGTPLLRSPMGALGARSWQRSPRSFSTSLRRARMFAPGYQPSPAELAELRAAITRRGGAAFAHRAAGFVAEHRRHADRWDLAALVGELDGAVAIHLAGSAEDSYEHRQIDAARRRLPGVDVRMLPGGHLTTVEHPDVLAAAITTVAHQHGVQP